MEMMKVFWIFLLLPTLALAQQHPIEPWQVFSILNENLDEDRWHDRAMLIEGVHVDVDLAIYVYNLDGHEFELVSYAENVAWKGLMSGTIPRLALNEAGNLQVLSMNDSIGRNRWHQILTIVYQDGEFLLTEYHYDSYDTIDLEASGSCDINLLSGHGEMTYQNENVEPFTHNLKAVPISEVAFEMARDECARYR